MFVVGFVISNLTRYFKVLRSDPQHPNFLYIITNLNIALVQRHLELYIATVGIYKDGY